MATRVILLEVGLILLRLFRCVQLGGIVISRSNDFFRCFRVLWTWESHLATLAVFEHSFNRNISQIAWTRVDDKEGEIRYTVKRQLLCCNEWMNKMAAIGLWGRRKFCSAISRYLRCIYTSCWFLFRLNREQSFRLINSCTAFENQEHVKNK